MQAAIPKRLVKGDCIGIVAPGSPASSPDKILRGIGYLERLGYNIKIGRSVRQILDHSIPAQKSKPKIKEREEWGYLSAPDRIRADDINEMFDDPHVQAIFCTRGGYGSIRLLSLIHYQTIRRNPKIFVGYSDITALHLAFYAKCKLVSFAGPMVAVEMQSGMDTYTEEHFWDIITSPGKRRAISSPDDEKLQVVSSGRAEGVLLGGNLAILSSLMGTKFIPRWDSSILFLEDVGEKIYRLDRMLAQLHHAGVLDKTLGILLGTFTEIIRDDPSLTLDEVFTHYFHSLKKPVLSNFPFGHSMPKATLPIGALIAVNSKSNIVRILGNVVI